MIEPDAEVVTGFIRPSRNQANLVRLSADGNTAIVGGSGDNSATGAAWVYTRSSGVWTRQGTKLVGTGTVRSSRQRMVEYGD